MTRRPGPQHIGTKGAVDGDYLGYDPDTDEYRPTPLAGGTGIVEAIVAGTNVSVDNTDPTHPIVSASGSGGGGGSASMGPDGKPTINTPPSSPNAKDDEFNDASGMSGPVNTLAGKWSKHNLGTAGWLILDDTKAPGCLMLDLPSTAQDQAVYQAVPAGDFRVTAKANFIKSGDRQMWGLFVFNTSGTGIALCLDDPAGDSLTRLRGVTSWVQSSAIATVASSMNAAWIGGGDTYLSLRKSGTTYYGAAWGADRILPVAAAEIAGVPSAFTPAYFGFGRVFGAGGAATGSAQVLLDWLRVS